MKKIISVIMVMFLIGCASAPKLPKPEPIHKLAIKWQAYPEGAMLSYEDYNRLGVWLTDVNRYIKDQKLIIQICEESK
ncbi:hypothetical protein Asfd1_8 [Aeromonas phage Asfd_1]|nr:hypothetical protein Asfd1_8 [Aeromonas phage Asfd_1]